MTDPIATRTHVAALDPAGRADAFTAVYQGYLRPLSMSATQMAAHVETNDIDLERSPLWLDAEGQAVGLGLVGSRAHRAWIGGFGVVPAWRGRGFALPLVEACLAGARAAGAVEIELEVLTGNDKAIRSYARAGFRETGRLAGFKGMIPPADTWARPADPAALLTCPLRPTCWQREATSLARMPALEAVALDDGAFVLFTRAEDAIVIRHLAAQRGDEIARLLAATGGQTATLVNEPADSPVSAGLSALGFEPFVSQHQMRMAL